jgi:hypothetical protein
MRSPLDTPNGNRVNDGHVAVRKDEQMVILAVSVRCRDQKANMHFPIVMEIDRVPDGCSPILWREQVRELGDTGANCFNRVIKP